MSGTNHQLFLMHFTKLKLFAEDKIGPGKHNFGAEHIVPKFNGAEVRILHFSLSSDLMMYVQNKMFGTQIMFYIEFMIDTKTSSFNALYRT